MDVLDLHQLNRATLARQGLLERRGTGDLLDVIDQLGGLQAQAPAPPWHGLWSRVAGLERDALRSHVASGEVVRGTTIRGTLHLVTAREYCATRNVIQPVLDAYLRSMRGRRFRPQDEEPALQIGRAMLDEGPQQIGAIRSALQDRFPDSESQALANVVRMTLPLLITADVSKVDGWATNAPFAHARDVLGPARPLAPAAEPSAMVRRYLAAFGPGTANDAQTWSGLRGLKTVMQQMLEAGELTTVLTHESVELYDLPDAPRPSGGHPAGVRFLARWDNLLLSHADRSRVLDPRFKPALASKNGMPPPVFLVDGFAHGTWNIERAQNVARLRLHPWLAIPSSAQDALVREGRDLLTFVAPDATIHDVRLGPG